MLVNELMTARPITVLADDSVKRALELLAERQISTLPVVDDRGRVIGVISEGDLVRELAPADRRAHALPVVVDADRPRRVAEVMTPDAVTVTPYTDVAQAVELMTSRGVKSVPVVDERGLVVGVLSRADVVRVLARTDEDLQRQVSDLLAELGLGGWGVRVRGGVAELDGPNDPAQSRVADAAAASVSGLVQVVHRTHEGPR